ncbi:MAG: cyclodeaminase/cyclohydrolase family protein [Myxococcota bacterium]
MSTCKEQRPSIQELECAVFVERLASADPTPGGGAALGVIASQGVALIEMALRISNKKQLPEIASQLQQLKTWRDRCLVLAQADQEGFLKVMEAWRLPRQTEQDKEMRSKRLCVCSEEAARVPLALMKLCVEVLGAAQVWSSLIKEHVLSDLLIGQELLRTAGSASFHNVVINTKSHPSLQPLQHQAERLLAKLQRTQDDA